MKKDDPGEIAAKWFGSDITTVPGNKDFPFKTARRKRKQRGGRGPSAFLMRKGP